jgi:ADP-ribose pyrophosphatase YjhB (NUDIX family)
MARAKHKSQSELFRELLIEKNNAQLTNKNKDSEDLLISVLGQDQEKMIIVGLAVIIHKDKVLIVQRTEKDKLVNNLEWAFPGGRLFTFDARSELQGSLKRSIGIEATVKFPISARVVPESAHKVRHVVALYFATEITNPVIKLEDTKYKAYRWVKPTDVFKYFTTSTSDEISNYLSRLESSST